MTDIFDQEATYLSVKTGRNQQPRVPSGDVSDEPSRWTPECWAPSLWCWRVAWHWGNHQMEPTGSWVIQGSHHFSPELAEWPPIWKDTNLAGTFLLFLWFIVTSFHVHKRLLLRMRGSDGLTLILGGAVGIRWGPRAPTTMVPMVI